MFETLAKKEYDKKIKFFESLPFLKHWTKNQIQKLMPAFAVKNFVRNQTVYSQGDPSDYIYIVEQGEFEIIR